MRRMARPVDDNRLVWIDLEMTGLEPDKHVIVEIATLITDDNLELIAEGIETEDERDKFLALGEMMGQGYLFGHPVSTDAASDLSDKSALRA